MKKHHEFCCLNAAIRGTLFFVVLFLLILCGFRASFAAEQVVPVKRVRIIYGLNPNFPAHQLFTKGLQDVFGQSSDKFQVEYSFEYLDLGLGKADENYRALLAEFLKKKYSEPIAKAEIRLNLPSPAYEARG